jgi:hypothetical protein
MTQNAMTGALTWPPSRIACASLFMLFTALLQPEGFAQRLDATFFATITVDQHAVRFEMALPERVMPESAGDAPALSLEAGGHGLQVLADGKPCPRAESPVQAAPDGSAGKRLALSYDCAKPPETLVVRYGFFDLLGEEHRTLALVVWPGGSQQFTFANGMRELRLDTRDGTISDGDTTSFGLGFGHFALGWGYLVFLGSLLVPVRSGRQLMSVAFSYALASSLGLALAGLASLQLPERSIAAAVAFTVLCAGAANLLRERQAEQRRWLAGAVAGAIHGILMAQPLLQATPLGDGAIRTFSGYLSGLQAGLIGFIALATPIVLWIHRNPWRNQAESVLSAIAVVLGTVAFIHALAG